MKSILDIFSKSEKEERQSVKEINLVKPKIIVDLHEKNSLVASELASLGCNVEFKHLHIGDYIVKDVVIERKTVSDFIGSMINRRLINQLQQMQQVQNKLLIIEGIEEQELYSSDKENNKVNENAIRGMMLSIVLSFQVPIILTKNYEDTASFLSVLAKKREKELNLNFKKKSRNVKEQIQYIIEGFPGIGPKTAKKLLKEFKTIKNIINASEEDLQKTIGKKADIFKLIDKNY
ncbi:hypothetical protein J4466_02490 [Candidatus Pacearchaeota archaeon]|nr:hypothetical protein [Candidatus Pacearchaeota archaeon]